MDNFKDKIIEKVHKAIVGQDEIIELLLLCILSEGHCIIVGVPGLAKTLLASSLAKVLGLKFSRIQFTPDLMPTDITGTEIIEENKKGERFFKFVKGPIFANFVLADEVNRTPPRTQSALLEAMQEKKVTYGREEYPIESPFFVIATQNPIEQEGTYPLPEAQLDRFMFSLKIDYPKEEEEKKIIASPPRSFSSDIESVTTKEELLKLQEEIRSIPLSKKVVDFVSALLRNSRPHTTKIELVKKYVEWGVSPRGGQYLLAGAKARAFIYGRPTPSLEDVRSLVHSVFDHRIIVNFLGEGEGIKSEDITEAILNETD
ncbi:MAG: MoxR family ATPase [candidate division WOR-3 bacterium]